MSSSPFFQTNLVYIINLIKYQIMEEKKITEAQSLEIITEMIARSNVRRKLGNGNIMLLWGYLTVIVSALVWALVGVTHNGLWNWLWFLIWIIGGIATPIMARKQRIEQGTKTYVDTISDVIWSIIGYMAIVMTFTCLTFLLAGGKDSWSAMFVFALLGVGFAEAVQGIVVKEKSLIIGGSIGILAGVIMLAAIAGKVVLYINWVMPMFIAAFICMMIIPGHILNAKARKEK